MYLTFVEAIVFGVGMKIGCDDCNNDGRTSPGSAIAMESGEETPTVVHVQVSPLARLRRTLSTVKSHP